MKALTVHQPWASLIVHGIKNVENRTWKTNFRGKVLIHAAARPFQMWNPNDVFTCAQWDSLENSIKRKLIHVSSFTPISSIIGSVEIIDCVQNHPSVWAEKDVYNWVIANPVLFDKPIENIKGRLTFWNFEGIKEGGEE